MYIAMVYLNRVDSMIGTQINSIILLEGDPESHVLICNDNSCIQMGERAFLGFHMI